MRLISLCSPLVTLICLSASASGQGTIDIQTTSFDTYIVVDVIVVDSGTGSGCASFILEREPLLGCGPHTTVATIPRQTGTVTHRYIDGPLTPNTAYLYSIRPCSGFAWVSDCGWGLTPTAPAMTTGPGATPIGHGYLGLGLPQWWLRPCQGLDCGSLGIVSLPDDARKYVGSDTAVILSGTFSRSCQFGWFVTVSQALPSPCTVSVNGTTWGAAKQLYRD